MDLVSQLTCLLPKLNRENILLDTVPESILTESRIYSEQLKGYTFIYKAEPEKVSEFIREFFYPNVAAPTQ